MACYFTLEQEPSNSAEMAGPTKSRPEPSGRRLDQSRVESVPDQHETCCNVVAMRCGVLQFIVILECGPMPNLMVALPNIGGALCSMPQSLADTHY